ncbi:MAG: protoheme IX farnesyltransferase [Gammaproteobacteria bacterium]|nr:protoheme IX farnesyltransferase [Gammaproteobacteria bacterium]NIR83467.1 protoheme IX farnesyltransferase [Gammaproteobacteria bacterium]NIR91389.1 protoheme IX farnesyltransferase [Gammaproteobacteria bacterium]NIU04629.1 protoheme IX farnesyltransferase [Gammaproteobacteria bacterium]NIV51671.1 protoheme IX farnesyltransferase [Gammaproteobacteria bacterium]
MSETVKLLYSVFKLRIGFAITLCALAGIAVTPGPGPAAWQMAVLALAVLASSASAGAFNQYIERDLDRRMRRTLGRPFVTGRFRAHRGWPVGLGMLLAVAVGGAALSVNPTSALYVFLGAFTYGVVYTVWLKRRTWLNIVLGGLAGSFAVLAGAAAVDPALSPTPLVLAVVLFLWTPPHFWSLAFVFREDYKAAGVPMLPAVVHARTAAYVILAHTFALVALSLVPLAYGLGWIYGVGAVAGGAWFLLASWRLARRPSPQAALANFRASLAQLGLLLGAAVLEASLAGTAVGL